MGLSEVLRGVGRLGAGVAMTIVVADTDSSSPSLQHLAGTIFEPRSTFNPEHPWTLHDEKYWQIDSPVSEDPFFTDRLEGNRGACSIGMVEVRGLMKLDAGPGFIEAMQSTMCTRWISETFPERCAEFDEARWLTYVASVPSKQMAFCVDRYEFPNAKGQFPWVYVTSNEAADLCAAEGKRLCSEDEWTFACEGEEAWPYPYGFARSSDACVIDRPWRAYDERAFAYRSSERAMQALDRLWQGEASGSRPACRSPFGVYDMTGNVDEWTEATVERGYRSVLKGGYWGPVRNRCRPATRAHGEGFAYYQQGFRCCSAIPSP